MATLVYLITIKKEEKKACSFTFDLCMKINDIISLTQSVENVYFQNDLYPDKGLGL